MKKLFFLIFIICLGPFNIMAQEHFTPPATRTSTWPYLFDDFSNAKIIDNNGSIQHMTINLNLLNDEMQFLNNGEIMQIYPPENVQSIMVNHLMYVYANKWFLQVIAKGEPMLVQRVHGNMNDLVETTGAYGTQSTVSSTHGLKSIDLGGINNMNYEYLKKGKEGGKSFNVETTYYFKLGQRLVTVSKSQSIKLFPDQKSKIKNYINQQNIDFKKQSDLLKLTEFLNTLEK